MCVCGVRWFALVQYNDAKRHIRADLARMGGIRADEAMAAELNALDTAVTCMLVAHTLARNALLLANHQVNFVSRENLNSIRSR